jgi:hypothetical protein
MIIKGTNLFILGSDQGLKNVKELYADTHEIEAVLGTEVEFVHEWQNAFYALNGSEL